jgi:hypothetical protein
VANRKYADAVIGFPFLSTLDRELSSPPSRLKTVPVGVPVPSGAPGVGMLTTRGWIETGVLLGARDVVERGYAGVAFRDP